MQTHQIIDHRAPWPRSREGRLAKYRLPYFSSPLLLALLLLIPTAGQAACPLPTLTVQPQSQAVSLGGSVSFTVLAVSPGCTVSYQWYGPQGLISGATGTNYTINPVSAGNAGNYYAVASVIGSSRQSSSATLTITYPNLTPYQLPGWSDKIVVTKTLGATTDDNPLTVTNSLYVDWAVVNIGTGPTVTTFANQLYLDGVLQATWNITPPMPAGTNFNAHVIGYPIGMLGTGTHTLRIKIDSGNAAVETDETDNEYTKPISVLGPPVITRQPQGQAVPIGSSAMFSVVVASAPPPTYQWCFNGGNISSATGSGYAITNAQMSQAGEYTVLVSNTWGAVTSVAARLTVTQPGFRQVVFHSNRGGNYALWRMWDDGTQLHQLTTNATDEVYPSVSPDGQQIAYLRVVAGGVEFRVMGADGANDHLVTSLSDPYAPSVAAWFPDNSGLVVCYGTTCSTRAYKLALDGSSMALFLDPAVVGKAEVNWLTFSQDGTKVTWSAADGCWSPTYEIYTAPYSAGTINTNAIIQVTANGNSDIHPAFSPDGSKVVFSRATGPSGYDAPNHVLIKNSDGTGTETWVADALYDGLSPAWSPGGGILLAGCPTADGASNNIYLVNPDGSGLSRLTDGGFNEGGAQWIAPPIRLSSPGFTTNGFQFTLTGPVGTYVIQASTNLATWNPMAVKATTSAGALYFTDTNASKYVQRYYRAAWTNYTTVQISSAGLTPNGFAFRVLGPPGTYVMRTSTNLTNWVSVATNSTPTGLWDYTNPGATGVGRRFYRARLQ